jgi:glycosyltransferase involved in cell wall biosynthesis
LSTPLVSVVLPTHNRAALLGRAVRSVLGQSHARLELIVVDDSSTDDTAAVLEAIEDDRMQVLSLDHNRGAAGARNAGIRWATGDLIAFQDSDDEWLPHKLELQIQLLQRSAPAVGAIGGRYTVAVGPKPLRMVAPHLESGHGYESDLLDGRTMVTPLWLVRRTLLDELDGFDESMACLEDWDLLLRISQRAAMRAVPEVLLLKYGAPDSLGGDVDLRPTAMEQLLARHGSRFRADRGRYASYCLEVAYLCLLRGRNRRAGEYALRALRSGGASPRLLAGFVDAVVRARVLHRPLSWWPAFKPLD